MIVAMRLVILSGIRSDEISLVAGTTYSFCIFQLKMMVQSFSTEDDGELSSTPVKTHSHFLPRAILLFQQCGVLGQQADRAPKPLTTGTFGSELFLTFALL
jgi:hypothetical protein